MLRATGIARRHFQLAIELNFNENYPGKPVKARSAETSMSSSTEARTRPRLRLYYAIMVSGFVVSVLALLTLSMTAFVLIAAVSVIAVIAAAMKLGVAGSQVVVDEPPRPPFSLRRLVAKARPNWRVIATWCVLMIAGFVMITVTRSIPVEWQGRAMFLAASGLLWMYALFGLGQTRAAFADLASTQRHRMRLALRAILGICLVILAAVFFYYSLQRDLIPGVSLAAIAVANTIFMLTQYVAAKSAPTPPAPSPPATE